MWVADMEFLFALPSLPCLSFSAHRTNTPAHRKMFARFLLSHKQFGITDTPNAVFLLLTEQTATPSKLAK